MIDSKEINWTDINLLQALADLNDNTGYLINPFFQIDTERWYAKPEEGASVLKTAAYADITLLSGRTIRASF